MMFFRKSPEADNPLFSAVADYIREHYVPCRPFAAKAAKLRKAAAPQSEEPADACYAAMPMAAADLPGLIVQPDAGFSETLLALIDRTGQKDADIYKKARIDRKLFSKIRSNPDYRPSKPTALSFAVALELSLEETKDLIGRAGFTLSHSSKFDIIIEYFLLHEMYDIQRINETLMEFDQSLLTG